MNEQLIALLETMGFKEVDTQNFDGIKTPLADDAHILGDLNELEKACYILSEQKKIEHAELHEKMSQGGLPPEEVLRLTTYHTFLTSTEKIIKELMWASITSRFVGPEGSTAFGIRKGNKIVAEFESDKGEHGIFSHFPGITIIELGHRG